MMNNDGLFEGNSGSPPIWNKGFKQESIEVEGEGEPTSVLDNRCSPSPPNSASTGGGGLAMENLEGFSGSLLPWFSSTAEIEDPGLSYKHLLQPPNLLDFGGNNYGMNDFQFCSDLRSSDSGSICNGGTNDSVNEKGSILNYVAQQLRVSDEKPKVFSPQYGTYEQDTQNPSCYVPFLGYNHLELPFEPPENRHDAGKVLYPGVIQGPKASFLGENHEFLLRNQGGQQFQVQQEELLMGMGLPPQFVPLHLEIPVDLNQQNSQALAALRDQLVKISEMFQTGNFSLAQVILARLNHQFSVSGNPLLRTAIFHVKEELEKLLTMNSLSPQPTSLSLLDVVNKMNAYKLFSETSPVMQFVEFTCTQALLEAFEDDDSIHILDFNIGCGSQWASFIRELPLRKRGAPLLKITAFASSSTHHPLELALVCGNIQEFANEFGVALELQVMNLDLFDPTSCKMPNFQHIKNETLAVNFPIWAFSHCPFVLCQVLSFIKQCSPKIMISFDRGCDRFDLSFPSHILCVLDSCSSMLESLHGSNVPSNISNKIEKFLIQPSIERAILGRIYSPDKMQANKAYQWKNLFTSVGFFPFPLSNFTESQADQVVKRTLGRGFQVEKQQASLVLSWMSRELVAASAWRC